MLDGVFTASRLIHTLWVLVQSRIPITVEFWSNTLSKSDISTFWFGDFFGIILSLEYFVISYFVVQSSYSGISSTFRYVVHV